MMSLFSTAIPKKPHFSRFDPLIRPQERPRSVVPVAQTAVRADALAITGTVHAWMVHMKEKP
jgi:hypothetical protein